MFSFVSENHKNVSFNPDNEIFNRYIHNLDEVFIAKSMVSEGSLLEKEKIVVPALEKLLVVMFIDTELFSTQQNEKKFIMRVIYMTFVNLTRKKRPTR